MYKRIDYSIHDYICIIGFKIANSQYEVYFLKCIKCVPWYCKAVTKLNAYLANPFSLYLNCMYILYLYATYLILRFQIISREYVSKFTGNITSIPFYNSIEMVSNKHYLIHWARFYIILKNIRYAYERKRNCSSTLLFWSYIILRMEHIIATLFHLNRKYIRVWRNAHTMVYAMNLSVDNC